MCLAVGLAVAAVAPNPARAQTEWNPERGLDPDGRIPAVDKAVPHPERWRYIPEGRIAPGPPWRRVLVTTFATPLFFYDDDIGVGGGLAAMDLDFRGQRRREFAGLFGSYTSEGQQTYGFAWRRWLYALDHPDGGVLQEDRSFARFSGGYRRTLTHRFFGLGDDSREDDETSYEDEVFEVEIGLDHAVPEPGADVVASLGLRGEFHELAPGAVDGDPTTDQLFPVLFDDAEHRNLGWLRAGLRWDTRDSQTQPYRGTRVGASVDAALLQSGGDVGARYRVEARHALRVPPLVHEGGDPDEENPPTDTLTLLVETTTTSGDLPFFSLASLGGSERLRGFIAGRYRDRSHWFAGAEWRVWLLPRGFRLPFTRGLRVERLGIAPFAELGSVADEWTDLASATPRASYGAGLRVAFERDTVFRADLGFADEGWNLSARFGLAY